VNLTKQKLLSRGILTPHGCSINPFQAAFYFPVALRLGLGVTGWFIGFGKKRCFFNFLKEKSSSG